MDSLTHIVLGACLGDVLAGKKWGRKAMLLGALAQTVPDFDFIGAFILDGADDLLFHRGPTHSWFFITVTAMGIAFFSSLFKSSKHSFSSSNRERVRQAGFLFIFWWSEMACHLLLDYCNNYGTAYWWPFSEERFAAHLLFVVDPLFTLVPIIAVPFLWWWRGRRKGRSILVSVVFTFCLLYIGMSAQHQHQIEAQLKEEVQHLPNKTGRYLITPAPFTTFLWMAVAEADSGYYLTHHSIWNPGKMAPLQFYPKNNHLAAGVEEESLQKMKLFSMNWYRLAQQQDTIVFQDIRFGQINGWKQQPAPFVFYYYIAPEGNNSLVVQRGRVKNWDRKTIQDYWEVIWGKPLPF